MQEVATPSLSGLLYWAKKPSAHVEQAVLVFGLDEYSPYGQVLHIALGTAPGTMKEPAGQLVPHEVALSPEYVPSGQTAHAWFNKYLPAVQSLQNFVFSFE